MVTASLAGATAPHSSCGWPLGRRRASGARTFRRGWAWASTAFTLDLTTMKLTDDGPVALCGARVRLRVAKANGHVA